MSPTPRYRQIDVGGCLGATLEERPGGVRVLRSTEALQPYPQRLTDRLEHWARTAPERTLAAKRRRGGDWERVSYAQMLQRARAIGQALAARGLSAERPVAVLSDNDLEHLSLMLACFWVGVPIVPVSPAYSLISQDYGKLRHILATTTPGLVFAASPAYAKAIAATVSPEVEVVMGEGGVDGRVTTPFAALLETVPGEAEATAHAQVGPASIAKFLFTSGSTKQPKAVINTHGMLCANLQMQSQAFAFMRDEPPVMVDWLPWNHTFGGNQNIGVCIYNGGTFHIDDGKPTAKGIEATLRNLREISPTIYFNVPKGFEEIVFAMDRDTALRDSLFKRLKAFMFAGAGLSQAVWDKLDAHAEASIGERVRMLTGLGMTETSPSSMFALGTDVRSGHIGLPCPGVEVKLVPMGDGPWDKTEVRFRGPNVMPGYWRAPEQTAEAFDEEGFYKTGDAAKFIDERDPNRGLLFDGRVAEDFKLSTGTFVSVGPMRAKIILEGAPFVQDAVLTGLNRDDLGMLVFPQLDACRQEALLDASATPEQVLAHPSVRGAFQSLVDRLWNEGTGSASRIARAWLLAEPPSIDKGEVTDKGSINQRAVLTHRAALVDALYEGSDPRVILPTQR